MPRNNKNSGKRNGGKKKRFWVVKVFIITLIISSLFSIISQEVLYTFDNITFALLTILVIVFIGVAFDIIGIAVAAASDVPFLSMAAKRIRGARQAIKLIKNADMVSNFCNDVVGDICGIISGAAGGILVMKVISFGFRQDVLNIIISSLIAALTVGGKALGKTVAINRSQEIIYAVGYFLSFFSGDSQNSKTRDKLLKRKRLE